MYILVNIAIHSECTTRRVLNIIFLLRHGTPPPCIAVTVIYCYRPVNTTVLEQLQFSTVTCHHLCVYALTFSLLPFNTGTRNNYYNTTLTPFSRLHAARAKYNALWRWWWCTRVYVMWAVQVLAPTSVGVRINSSRHVVSPLHAAARSGGAPCDGTARRGFVV